MSGIFARCSFFLALALSCSWLSISNSAFAATREPEGVWGRPVGVDPCGSETDLEARLANDPALASRRALLENMVREAERNGLLPPRVVGPGLNAAPIYIVPVAVHIVHQGGTENISDNQVLSQIDALNRDCQNLLGYGSPATDTQIKFCLAQNLPPNSTVTWSTTPGITRANSPETNNVFGNAVSEAALKAIDYLPSNRYLNIWVVKQITGGSGGIVGYAPFPGTVPPTLDGIVMAHICFGSNTTGYGTFPTLIPSNNDGKVLTHEVGHYLDLFHTFHLGCTFPGDQVTDTPFEAVNNWGCPTTAPLSCSTSPDPIENFMDYTNDACRFAFTPGQTTRMHAAIGGYRSMLVSAGNLIFTGCSSGLNALISATPGQVCPNGTIQFSTPATGTGYTYAWTFTGGTPGTANTQYASSQFAAVGPHTVTLTVTDGGSNFSTNSIQVYAVNCTPITGPCANWVWAVKCRLDFATGIPVAVNGTQNGGVGGNGDYEAAAQISDNSGNLLFYSDADRVWDKNNNVMPNGTGILGGTSSHNGAIIVPRPGSSTQYFLFTIRPEEDGNVPNPVLVSTVDMTLNGGNGDVVTSQKNVPVAHPGNPTFMMQGQTLLPHCNGVDWWYITHGAGTSWSGNLYVTLVTSAGPTSSIAYPIGIGFGFINTLGTITASRDGSKLAAIQWTSQTIRVYNFDRTTGVPTLALNTGPIRAYADATFSPNGKVLYYDTWSPYELHQLDIATSQVRVLGTTGIEHDTELGPDGKIYVSMAGQNAVGCINFPDNFNTFNANECGYNPSSVPLGAGTNSFIVGPLPNTLQMCSATQPAQFTYTVTNCLTVQFHAVNCSGPYSWNFGDTSTGSGQNVSHTYSSQGTYNVQLTVMGATPPTITIPITLAATPVTIAGSTTACPKPANYSVNGPSNYTYQWTVSGGSPTSATGNNVDVTWGATGGTITVAATDPATGCTSTAGLNVGSCVLHVHKYNDLNHNGVRDPVEAGLGDWTINLTGTSTGSGVTNLNGDYDFTNLSNGTYYLTEVTKPGWIVTAPPGGTMGLSTLSGFNADVSFGNFRCESTATACAKPPPCITAWYAFDDCTGPTTRELVAGNTGNLLSGPVWGVGHSGCGLAFNTASARVWAASRALNNFGTGSFSIDAWIRVAHSPLGAQYIVDKRTGTTSNPTGYALFLYGERLGVQVADGTNNTSFIGGPVLTAGTWHHVAATVCRGPGITPTVTLYVNGIVGATYTAGVPTGSVTNSAQLWMGNRQVSGFLPLYGELDEVELYQCCLSPAEVNTIFAAGILGKCKERCYLPQLIPQKKNGISYTNVTICNNTAQVQIYHWTLAGLPVGSGCPVSGPVNFSPLAGTLTLNPGQCTSQPVTINGPPLALFASACYQLTVVNDSTDLCCTKTGRIRRYWWWMIDLPLERIQVGVPPPGGSLTTRHLVNDDTMPHRANYRVSVTDEDGNPDTTVVSLNGLPPGTPVTGAFAVAAGDSMPISYAVSMVEFEPFEPYTILIEADLDEDGIFQPIALHTVIGSAPGSESVSTPDAIVAEELSLSVRPNPFNSRMVVDFTSSRAAKAKIAVYDISGRLVRVLREGPLVSGRHQFEWDGRDAHGAQMRVGIYFVRAQVDDQTRLSKVVLHR